MPGHLRFGRDSKHHLSFSNRINHHGSHADERTWPYRDSVPDGGSNTEVAARPDVPPTCHTYTSTDDRMGPNHCIVMDYRIKVDNAIPAYLCVRSDGNIRIDDTAWLDDSTRGNIRTGMDQRRKPLLAKTQSLVDVPSHKHIRRIRDSDENLSSPESVEVRRCPQNANAAHLSSCQFGIVIQDTDNMPATR